MSRRTRKLLVPEVRTKAFTPYTIDRRSHLPQGKKPQFPPRRPTVLSRSALKWRRKEDKQEHKLKSVDCNKEGNFRLPGKKCSQQTDCQENSSCLNVPAGHNGCHWRSKALMEKADAKCKEKREEIISRLDEANFGKTTTLLLTPQLHRSEETRGSYISGYNLNTTKNNFTV
ncbi:hypothetical protein J6590_098942 [Homalodisca vitripennis]|nr:hypothetical protein J6590_098942 [Homalodisca vitripennis]